MTPVVIFRSSATGRCAVDIGEGEQQIDPDRLIENIFDRVLGVAAFFAPRRVSPAPPCAGVGDGF